MGSITSKLQQVNWDFPSYDSTEGINSIHPYPAKFIQEIPRRLIESVGLPSNTWVLDPFCGSGSTLVEAQRAGYPSVGIDLNPIACLITEVKTSPLPSDFRQQAANIVVQARLGSEDVVIPEIPNLDHWFKQDVQEAIVRLLDGIEATSDGAIRRALRLALSSVLVRVSNQESDTRYAAVEKQLNREKVYTLFSAAAERIAAAKEAYQPKTWEAEVLCRDILQVSTKDIPHPVGLVITSPPYPNAYEYWLYHKYRMFWLGYDPISVKNQEIGARAHYFKKNRPTEEDFIRIVNTVMQLLWSVVVPGGHVCMVIGRSRIHGEIVDNAATVRTVGSQIGFQLLADIPRIIAPTRKAFNLSHANILNENLLVFERA